MTGRKSLALLFLIVLGLMFSAAADLSITPTFVHVSFTPPGKNGQLPARYLNFLSKENVDLSDPDTHYSFALGDGNTIEAYPVFRFKNNDERYTLAEANNAGYGISCSWNVSESGLKFGMDCSLDELAKGDLDAAGFALDGLDQYAFNVSVGEHRARGVLEAVYPVIDFDGYRVTGYAGNDFNASFDGGVLWFSKDVWSDQEHIDPSFGYTTEGGSLDSWGWRILSLEAAADQSGTISNITVLLGYVGYSEKCKAALYFANGSLVAVTDEWVIPEDYADWVALNFSAKVNVSVGNYRLAVWFDDVSSGIGYAYTSDSNAVSSVDYHYYTGTFPDPITWGADTDQNISIYAVIESSTSSTTTTTSTSSTTSTTTTTTTTTTSTTSSTSTSTSSSSSTSSTSSSSTTSTTSSTVPISISNASVSSPVLLGDYVRAAILLESNGSGVEGESCSVSVYDSGGGLVKMYRNACPNNDIFLDSNGNFVSHSSCPFSDSLGFYRFMGRVSSAEGFIYSGSYVLRFVCEGASVDLPFSVDLGKSSWDFNELTAFVVRRGGEIVFWIILGLFAFLSMGLIIGLFWKGRKPPKG